MVPARIRAVLIQVIPIINAVIVYVPIKAVFNSVIVVVVNVCIGITVIDFFSVIQTISVIVIVFMVVYAVIVVVRWVVIGCIRNAIVIIV